MRAHGMLRCLALPGQGGPRPQSTSRVPLCRAGSSGAVLQWTLMRAGCRAGAARPGHAGRPCSSHGSRPAGRGGGGGERQRCGAGRPAVARRRPCAASRRPGWHGCRRRADGGSRGLRRGAVTGRGQAIPHPRGASVGRRWKQRRGRREETGTEPAARGTSAPPAWRRPRCPPRPSCGGGLSLMPWEEATYGAQVAL